MGTMYRCGLALSARCIVELRRCVVVCGCRFTTVAGCIQLCQDAVECNAIDCETPSCKVTKNMGLRQQAKTQNY